MGYSIGIILLVANLVVISASYGYSAPSVAAPVNSYGASYGPSENPKDYPTPEPAVPEPEPETPEVVVEPTSPVIKENGPTEEPAAPFNSYASAYNQGYEQGYAYGQGYTSPQPQTQPQPQPVVSPTVATPIVNPSSAMHAGQFNGFTASGHAAPAFESFDIRGPQFPQGLMQHQGQMMQMMPVMPNLSMRPMNPTAFNPNNRRPIITSGPGLMVMTSPSAGVVPLTDNDQDIPANMIFGIGNRKPARPMFSFSSNNNLRPTRFGFATNQGTSMPSVFNKFNGFGNANVFPFSGNNNNRNQGFGNNRFNNQFNGQFNNQFNNQLNSQFNSQFNNQGFGNGNRNRRSAQWEEYRVMPVPTQFW